MSATQDFVALDWIKGNISETLDQAQQALEAVAQSADDSGSMRSCLTALHQVHGTLRMVELEGPAQLSAEMEELAQALMSSEVPDVSKAQEVLMQAILQLPGYLDRIQREQKDSPVVIRPIVNSLRIARGESRLDGGAPEQSENPAVEALTRPASADVGAAFNSANGPVNAGKLRVRYQRALVALLKRNNPRENLTLMGKVFSMFIRLCGESPQGSIFQLALAVIEGIGGGAVKLDSDVAASLKDLDREMKALSEQGEAALSALVSPELGDDLLRIVFGASRETPRIAAARKKFAQVADEAPAKEEEVSFGPDDETIAAVGRILIEELTGITDKLDLYVRSANPGVKDLADLVPQLEQIRGTMSVVGLTDHQQSVNREIETIRALEAGGEAPGEDVLLNMARAFLEMEAALKVIVGDADEGEEGFGNLSEAEITVIKETRNSLAQCKDAVIEYVSGDFDKSKIEDIPGLLRALRGGLSIINQNRGADVLLACAAYVDNRLLRGDDLPALSDMDDLADAVTSVDYYLERFIENPKEPYLQMVEVAEAAITKLGYPPGQIDVQPTSPVAEPGARQADDESEAIASAVADSTETLVSEAQVDVAEAATAPDEIAEPAELAPSADADDQVEPPVPDDALQAEPTDSVAEPGQGEEAFGAADEPASANAEVAESALVDDEIIEIFIEEAREVLDSINEFFPPWQSNPADADSLTEVRRAFHTLKGSGRMVGATVVGELAWTVENMLNRVIDKSIDASPAVIEVVSDVIARLPEGIEKFETGVQDTFNVDELMSRAEALAAGEGLPEGDVGATVEEMDFDASLFATSQAPQAMPPVETRDEQATELTSESSAEIPAGLDDLSLDSFGEEAADAEQDELDEIFVAEAGEHIDTVRAYVTNPGFVSADLVAAFHTLKGSAGMAEVPAIARVAAPLEKLAGQRLDGAGDPETFDSLCARGAALIEAILQDLASRREDYEGVDAFCTEANALLSDAAQTDVRRFDFENVRLLSTPEAVLEAWDEAQVSGLADELRGVIDQAQSINQPALLDLAGSLLGIYEKLSARPTDAVASALARGHEHLVSMFDHIAASQDVVPVPHVVEALQNLDVSGAPAQPAPSEPAATELPADEIDEDVLPLFLEEAEELSEGIDQSILDWSAAPADDSQLDNLLRQLHTMKGGARLAGLNSLGEYTHDFETFLIDVQKNPVDLDDGFFALLNERQDEITRRIGIYNKIAVQQATEDEIASMRYSAAAPAPASTARRVPATAAAQEESVAQPASPAEVVELPADEIDEDILPVFLEEADELVEAIDQSILDWSGAPASSEPFDNLLRQLHTLKGGARLAGMASLGEYTHNFETFLTGLKLHPVTLDEAFFALVNRHQDEINRRVGIYKKLAAGEATAEELDSMRTAAEAGTPARAEASSAALEDTGEPAPTAETQPRPVQAGLPQQEMVRVSSDLLEELISLAGESSITRGRVEQQIADFGEALEEMEETIERIREHVRRLEIEAESRETVFHSRQRDDANAAFDELEMDRYTMLQEISRALSEGTSDMTDLKDTLVNKSRDAETLLHQQARVGSELQEGLTRTRMVPFARLIPRLRRIVRQISNEVGKSVRFDAYNVEGELDRNVLERIVAPLEHMLRNAVDHGIESADKRRAAGKPEQGRISLRLSREGGYVVLTVSDDGGGINIDAVRAKAIERGLMSEDSQLSDQEVRQFIMHAGFSTAQKLTQISGRGVGMDVVASEIKQLGGTITIDSTLGVGTEFTIQLPFTVSINRALMVVVQDETYAVPLNTIEGIYRVSPYELEAYYQPDAPMFEAAGQPYRLVYMGKLLDKSVEPNLEGQVVPLPVILARSGANAVAFQVDKVIGSREVVVKSLGQQFNEVAGLSGATVMGDGSVVIILDVMALVRGADARAAETQPVEEPVPENRVRKVMIVDDSVTVRKVTSRLMERQGWDVVTAKDGIDAMSQLQETYPDIVLLDIEMPRMDGFEVLRAVRRDERLQNIPIIMITSRTGEKHQQQALELGVNRYLGKPFQEANLLATIEEVIAEAGAG